VDNHPTFQLFMNGQVISQDAGQTQALVTDTSTLYDTWTAGTGGTKVGLMVQCGTTADDTHGVQATGTFLVTDAILLTSDTSTAAAGQTITVHLTGTNTGWTPGTPGTPTFTLSGGTGASISAQTVVDATHATLTVHTGTAAGTLTITDPLNGLTVTLLVTVGLSLIVPPDPIIAGRDNGYVIIGVSPPGTVLGGTINATLSDGASGVFTPPTVALSPSASVAYALYRPLTTGNKVISVTNDGGMTNPAPQTVAVRQLAGGYTAASGSGAVGTVGDPITVTVALTPSGSAVPVPLGVFVTPSGAEALLSAGGLSLDGTTGSGTLTITPLETGTLTLTFSNDGGYANPAPLVITVGLAPTYTISGRRVGPSTKASRRFLFAMRDGTFVGDVPLVLGSGGAGGTFTRTDTGATVTSITLNNSTAPSIPVAWTPPATILDGDADGLRRVLISGTHSTGAAVDPTPHIYDVYDPARWAARMVSAPYGSAAAGQAATIGLVAYDSDGVVVIAHTTDYTAESSPGNYIALLPLPIDDGWSVDWDLPAGIDNPPEYTQTGDPVDAVNPVLSSLDYSGVTTELQRSGGGVRLAPFAAMGITTFTAAQVRADPNYLLKMLVSALVNQPEKDAAGNLVYHADDGTTVQVTIPTTDDGGTFSLGTPS
jgi:hypothetical protein